MESDSGRSSYLDLLISTLMEHEKSLDRLVEKIENISETLSSLSKEFPKKIEKYKEDKEKKDNNAISYLKINLDRPIDDILKIIKTLKE